jgi:ATP-binding cassette subfamily B protein
MTERHNVAETSRAALHEFLPYLSQQSGRIATAYATSLLSVALALLLPWPLKFMIDGVLVANSTVAVIGMLTKGQQLLVLAGAMTMLAALAATVQAREKVLHAKVREKFSFALRDDLVQKLYRLSRDTRQAEMSGELTMRMVSDTQLLSRLFCKTFPTAIKHGLTAVATLLAIVAISRSIGLVSLLMAALLAVLVVHHGPRLAAAAAAKRHQEGHVSAHTQENIHAIEHIQAMGLEEQSRHRYLQKARASLSAGVDEIRVAVRLERSSQIVAGLSLAAVAGLGGLAVTRGHLSLGELTVCLSYLTQLLKPIERINEIAKSISRGLARAARIRDLLAAETTPESPGGALLSEPIASISCRNLRFQYAGSVSALVSRLNHVFRLGECTAIVGPSGCGKSTLLRLLMGLQSPTHGSIRANDLAYDELHLGQLRTQFAVLLQDPHLFAGSVRDIVTEINSSAADDDIRRVLDDVHMMTEVDALRQGLDTPIDEAGARFSTGQRTRLLLARALLSQRPVLLLDEPFANLDDKSRRIILNCLAAAKKSRIVIVVTHELGLLELADHVLTEENFSGIGESTCERILKPETGESDHAVA